jgi:hypothetical protein
MSPHTTGRLPVSTRHAIALAFDLAFRRDPLHSIVVPTLLRAPWVIVWAMNAPIDGAIPTPGSLLAASLALVGDFITLIVVGAMLRIRARSVFNTPPGTRPAPALECYARGLRRVGWLFLTESVRNGSLAIAATFSILPTAFVRLSWESLSSQLAPQLLLLGAAAMLSLPALFLGFRLAVATEAVVLDDHDLAGAFQHSFRLMRGRFERWLELIAASAVVVLALALVVAALTVAAPPLGEGGSSFFWLLVVAFTPPIQYAWTFFYLRLIEVEPSASPGSPRPGPGNGLAAAAPPAGSPATEAVRGK